MVNLSTELYNLFDSDGSHIVSFLEWLQKAYQLPVTLDILDVGCGPGRILLPMADLGWRVVGMEPYDDYYAAALKTTDQYENITVIKGGFADIEQESVFDMIVAVNTPFSYLLTIEAQVDAIKRLHRALKPDGVLFLDLPNFLYILKNYKEPQPSLSTAPNGDIVRRVIQHDIDFHNNTFTHTDQFYIDDELKDEQVHKMAIITLSDILYFLRQTHFVDVMTFNGFGARENQTIRGARMMIASRKSIRS